MRRLGLGRRDGIGCDHGGNLARTGYRSTGNGGWGMECGSRDGWECEFGFSPRRKRAVDETERSGGRATGHCWARN